MSFLGGSGSSNQGDDAAQRRKERQREADVWNRQAKEHDKQANLSDAIADRKAETAKSLRRDANNADPRKRPEMIRNAERLERHVRKARQQARWHRERADVARRQARRALQR